MSKISRRQFPKLIAIYASFAIYAFSHANVIRRVFAEEHGNNFEKFSILRGVDRGKLKYIWSNTGVRNIYKKNVHVYRAWAKSLSSYTIPSQRGEKIVFGPEELVEFLALTIVNFDLELATLASSPAVRDRLGVDHREIADLFARNVLDISPVIPN